MLFINVNNHLNLSILKCIFCVLNLISILCCQKLRHYGAIAVCFWDCHAFLVFREEMGSYHYTVICSFSLPVFLREEEMCSPFFPTCSLQAFNLKSFSLVLIFHSLSHSGSLSLFPFPQLTLTLFFCLHNLEGFLFFIHWNVCAWKIFL